MLGGNSSSAGNRQANCTGCLLVLLLLLLLQLQLSGVLPRLELHQAGNLRLHLPIQQAPGALQVRQLQGQIGRPAAIFRPLVAKLVLQKLHKVLLEEAGVELALKIDKELPADVEAADQRGKGVPQLVEEVDDQQYEEGEVLQDLAVGGVQQLLLLLLLLSIEQLQLSCGRRCTLMVMLLLLVVMG